MQTPFVTTLPDTATLPSVTGSITRRRLLATVSVAALSSAAPGWVLGQTIGPLPPQPWVALLARPVAPPVGEKGRQFAARVAFAPSVKVTPGERQAWEAQMRAISVYLGLVPIINPTHGTYPTLNGFGAILALGPYINTPATAPVVGGVTMMPWRREDVNLAADGTPTLKSGVELAGVRVEVNYVYPLSHANWMEDDAGEFGPLSIMGECAGYPVIDEALVVTRDGKLPFVPVSQDRVLKAFIKRFGNEGKRVQAGIDEARQAYDAYMAPAEVARRRAKIDAELARLDPSNREAQRRYLDMWDRTDGEKLLKKARPDLERDPGYSQWRGVRDAEQRLAAMNAQERAKPAWIDPDPQHHQTALPLLPEGQGAPMMAVDPEFWDRKKPRTVMRVALVRQMRQFAEAAHEPDHGQPGNSFVGRTNLTFFQQVNWRDFAEKFLQSK
jgi:hypothetical protein